MSNNSKGWVKRLPGERMYTRCRNTSTNARALQRAKNIVKHAPCDSKCHFLYPVLINIGYKFIILSLFGV